MPTTSLRIPPTADPNYPQKTSTITVSVSEVFTEDQIEWLESVLWSYESTNPEARRTVTNLQMLESIRVVLANLKPQPGQNWIHLLTQGL